MVQITPLVPEVSSLAPQAQVDSNIQLITVLQQLMDQNKPKTDVSQASPDQVAAASANSKEVAPAPITDGGDKKPASASLPDILKMLGLGTPDQGDKASAVADKTKTGAPAIQSGKTLKELFNGSFGDTKPGAAINDVKQIGAFFGL